MGIPYIPDSSKIVAADLIGTSSSGGTPPTSGQYVEWTKLDIGSGGVSQPVALYLPVAPITGTKVFYPASGVAPLSGTGQLLALNSGRIEATFYNNGAATIWLGLSGVSVSGGFPLLATASLTDKSSKDVWAYALLSGTTCDLRYFEVSQ